MAHALLAAPRSQRELDRLPSAVADGVRQVLQTLAKEPRGPRFDLKALRAIDGHPPALRLRIGDYRVILRIDHGAREILLARIGHRKTVYRGLPASYD